MTVSTLRPSSTITNVGVGLTGAASVHAALSDDSDSSYIKNIAAGDYVTLELDDLSLPTDAVILSVALRVRTSVTTGALSLIHLYVNQGYYSIITSTFASNWVTPNTVTAGIVTHDYDLNQLTDPIVDLLTLTIEGFGSGAGYSPDERVYEAYLDVTYVVKPVTAPSAPTGTLTTTNLPTVTWANTLDSDGGGTQDAFEVKIFSAAQYGAGGFDPSTSTSTLSTSVTPASDTAWTPDTPLVNATYRAYVRVAQTVNGTLLWSDWAYTGFVVNVDLPAVPDTPTLTAEPASGRIKVHVEGNSGLATTTDLEVQRSEDGGTTWEPLRLTTDTAGVIAGTSADVYDYEAPNGILMTYRVRALHNYSGLYAASAWASTATATWSSSAVWLKAPESPSLNMVIEPDSIPGYQRPARQGVFQALGRTDQIVIADTAGAARGTLKISVASSTERADLDALLDSGLTLLLQCPLAEAEPDRYLRFGDQDRARWIDKGFATERIDTLAWFEVLPPPGVIDGWPA